MIRRQIVRALLLAGIVCLSKASTAGWQSRDSNYNKTVGAPPWTPASIPGLQLWLEADLGVSETAGKITSWTDQSSNAFVFTPYTTGPSWSATGFNGASPGVILPGGDQQGLFCSGFALATTATLSLFIVGTITDADGNRIFAFYSAADADTTTPAFTVYNPSTWTLYSSGLVAGGSFGSLNTPQSAGWIFDGTNAHSYLNETLVNSAAFSASLVGAGLVPYLGGNPGGGSSTSGNVAAIILSNQVISAPNLTKLSAYLTAKYGIPL